MAQLIDILLVTSAVSAAVWAVIQYFIKLGRDPGVRGVGCACGSASCSTGETSNSILDEIRQLKKINNLS